MIVLGKIEKIIVELGEEDMKRLEEKGVDKLKLKEILEEYARKALLVNVGRLQRKGG